MFNKSIAIIDDNPDLLNLFSEALQMSGYIMFLVSLTLVWHINISRKTQINTLY